MQRISHHRVSTVTPMGHELAHPYLGDPVLLRYGLI
jgi:hypothetical protein